MFIYVPCRVGGSHLAIFLFTCVLQCVLSVFLPTRLTGFQARGGGWGCGGWTARAVGDAWTGTNHEHRLTESYRISLIICTVYVFTDIYI